MSITAYFIKDSSGVDRKVPMHDRAVADSHVAHISQYYRDGEERPAVVEEQIDRLLGSIFVRGSQIGYQYAQTRMGVRTYRNRQISQLRRGPDKRYYGRAVIEGRILSVSTTHLGGLWFFDQLLGYTE
jgi:hypothetical protein